MNLTKIPSIHYDASTEKNLPKKEIKKPKSWTFLETMPHVIVVNWFPTLIPGVGDMKEYFAMVLNPCDLEEIKILTNKGFTNSKRYPNMALDYELSQADIAWFKNIYSENYICVQRYPGKIYDLKGSVLKNGISFKTAFEANLENVRQFLQDNEVELYRFEIKLRIRKKQW